MHKTEHSHALQVTAIVAGIILAIILAMAFLVHITPKADDPVQKLYAKVAYNAAMLQGDIEQHHDAQTLSELTHPYREGFVGKGVISPDSKSVVWTTEVSAVSNKEGFFSSAEQINVRACAKLSAHVASQTVMVTPLPCEQVEKEDSFVGQSGREVQLDQAKILEARRSRSSHLDCQVLGEGRKTCQ